MTISKAVKGKAYRIIWHSNKNKAATNMSNYPQTLTMTVVQMEQLQVAMAEQERQIMQAIISVRANTLAVDRTQIQDTGLIWVLYTARKERPEEKKRAKRALGKEGE